MVAAGDGDLRERLEAAAKVVEGLPDDLRTIAFAKAFDELGSGERKSQRGKGSGRRYGSTKKAALATKSSKANAPSKSRAGGKRPGGMAAIRDVVDEGFFTTKRTLPQIRDFLRKKKVLAFKASDLSSPLAQLTRKGVLQREENGEGTFEYWVD